MQTCKKCIVPDTYPEIIFRNGVCGFCETQEKNTKKNDTVLGEKKLLEIITSKKSGLYDCIVPLSGGKDSTYVLWYLANKLKLKPLAVFFDNGFIIEAAKKNVEKICANLNADLVVGHATKYRRLQAIEALYIAKDLGRFIKVCGNCENNLRTFAINEAVKRNIPFIVWGSTDFEDKSERFTKTDDVSERKKYGTWQSMAGKIKTAAKIYFNGGKSSNKLKIGWHAVKFMYYLVKDNIASETSAGLKKYNPFLEVSFKDKGAEAVYFYDFIKYDPFKNIEILKNEIGWEAPRDKESRMDCALHGFVNYQHLKDTGMTADGFTLSVLVRNGLIGKDEAERKESAMKVGLDKECEAVARELGVNNILGN